MPVGRTVQVISLDDYCESREIHYIDFVKIDCEGYDFRVIQGVGRLLESHRIRFIQFEYGKSWQIAGATLTAAFHFLRNYGYELFRIENRGLRRWRPEQTGEFFHYSNFLAVSSDGLPEAMLLVKK